MRSYIALEQHALVLSVFQNVMFLLMTCLKDIQAAAKAVDHDGDIDTG